MRARVVACVLLASGCGDPAPATPDAHPCVFEPPAAPTGGMLELGAASPDAPAGLATFTPVMEQGDFQVYAGPQVGFHVWIHVRFKDLDLGDEADVFTRPQTRFSVYVADGTRVNLEECGYRLPSQQGGDGFTYLQVAWLTQLISAVAAELDDDPLRLRVEVLDRNGKYAVDERMVNALKAIPTDIGP